MSTCSTATSTHRVRGRESRRPPASSNGGRGHLVLERRLLDLERDWDAYKTVVRRSGAPRRSRRSRSATATPTPSSAVTVVAAPERILLPLLRRSPRRLVWLLQQQTSSDESAAGGAAKIRQQGDDGAPAGPYDEDASSVCSVEGGYSVATTSSSSSSCSRCESCCPCQRAVLCCGYSASSSCSCAGSTTTAPLSSSPAGGINNSERARKVGEGKWVWVAGSRVLWISAIALLVMVFVTMVIFEVGVDEGGDEYLVPT